MNGMTEPIPGLPAGSGYQRDLWPKAVGHFQVNSKFRRYWSGNTVFEGEKQSNQLRFCPDCHDVIEHDERGHPRCLTCGSIFPLPRKVIPASPEKLERHRKALERRFIRRCKAEDYAEIKRETKAQKKAKRR